MAKISIHAPARGGDGRIAHQHSAKHISIHAPARGATLPVEIRRGEVQFQSTPPRGGATGMTGQPR